jgi:hypothetical protein
MVMNTGQLKSDAKTASPGTSSGSASAHVFTSWPQAALAEPHDQIVSDCNSRARIALPFLALRSAPQSPRKSRAGTRKFCALAFVNKRFPRDSRAQKNLRPLCVIRTFGKHSKNTTDKLQFKNRTPFCTSHFVLVRTRSGAWRRRYNLARHNEKRRAGRNLHGAELIELVRLYSAAARP